MFFNLASLFIALLAFWQYWMSKEVNFLELSLGSSNQPMECR